MRHKLPAMMFYFGDWFKATDVRMCSLEARGLWIDLLGIMWESDNPGYLESNGTPLNVTFIGRVIGGDKGQIERCLAELEAAGLFSRDDRGVIYCRRMVRDIHKRLACKEAGAKGGGNPALKRDHSPLNGGLKDTFKGDYVNDYVIETELSTLLYSLIKNRNPGHREPNITAWAKHIDLMIRVDKRNPEDIKAVINWCQADSFWQNNILSTAKLREQYDQLVLKMKSSQPKNPLTGIAKL